MKKFASCLCALALVAFLLPGCSHKEEEPACPATGLVKGAGASPIITGTAEHPAGGDLAAIGFVKIHGDCSFKKYSKTKQVRMDLTLAFAGQRGTKGEDLKGQKFPYFVAVLSPDDTILQRQEFSTSVDFDKTGSGASSEEYTVYIPVSQKNQAPAYKVAVGFSLTPRQVDYNRENHAD